MTTVKGTDTCLCLGHVQGEVLLLQVSLITQMLSLAYPREKPCGT